MEVILVAAWVASYFWVWMQCRALENRCTYLEHLVGDLLKRQPDRLEGDEWKDSAAEDEA